jgi:stage III sporulation protein AG
VTVTLETGITYVYADETRQNTSADSDRQSEETEQKYITVTDSNGTETPLVLTSHMPKVRGVAIVCSLNDETAAEKIKNAVMAAFDLTSKKVYIADKGRNILK